MFRLKQIRESLIVGIIFGCSYAVFAEEPALPPGLGDVAPPATSDAPALPSGLGDAPAEPGLPPGLGEDSGDPALPPGLGEASPETAPDEAPAPPLRERLSIPIHGFWETRAGIRIDKDYAQPADATIAETRLQLKTSRNWGQVSTELTGDVYLDGVLEATAFDLRQARITWSPIPSMDVRVGRQVLTWGTGDMLFINDLFPKDWQSFFIGRDDEYLKAPSDAVRIGWYHPMANVEVVYTPQFAPDRFIRGQRISFWNPILGRHAGKHHQADFNAPSTWFEDDELALRLYRNVGSWEFALYGYSGYWKSPGGQRLWPFMQASFPKLAVYGASARGTLGRGIANLEVGYYDSRQDRQGNNPFVNNSEFRLLLGYEQELAKEFTGAVQYYLEHMTDYGDYERTLPFFAPQRDKNRHLFTVRLTKMLMNQNLVLSLFTYYSPSDADLYLRPRVTYKANDAWTLYGGFNLFTGREETTFFGQFENNSNVFVGARYSF